MLIWVNLLAIFKRRNRLGDWKAGAVIDEMSKDGNRARRIELHVPLRMLLVLVKQHIGILGGDALQVKRESKAARA